VATVTQPGRDDLAEWRASKSTNFYDATPQLALSLDLWMGERGTDDLRHRLGAFGHVVATEIDGDVEAAERNREFPKLRPFNAIGQRVEQIEFYPSHEDAARATWASGMLATPLTFDGAFELASLFFLLSNVGEGGQACPVVCTLGLRRALERRGSEELKDQYLQGLSGVDSATALRGSQFLTEVQGGSDVGANATIAVEDPANPGAWRIHGEKWFCSVVDADLFAMTARPEGAPAGTKGLACFLVPRSIDGVSPNGFRIRRLKDKLGTRALASAEIDFEGALGWPIGTLDEGFAIAVSELLNTSRWLNALGSTGIMNRTYLEASSFARHRHAFGVSIDTFDAVKEQLAIMRIETAAAVASTMALTYLVGRIDEGSASDEEVLLHRFLVNANKYVTSITASDVVHRGIEVLGGNGTIEDFSPLPRLYRDAIVFESWEGTHNVLCAQVRRDCGRLGLLRVIETWIDHELSLVDGSLTNDVEHVRRALDSLGPALIKTVENPSESAALFRRQLTLLTRVVQATCLLRVASHPVSTTSDVAIVSAFVGRHLSTLGFAEEPSWYGFVDGVLS
jgi:alkylation response protein AidB-like acyl-CoA dehydrogenase